MEKQEREISKFLSLILRHKPETVGIFLDEHGWANVQELLNGMNKTTTIDMEMLDKIVTEDEKMRYSFNSDKTMIRANQGHSIQVDVEFKKETPPDILWHGTGQKYVDSIDKNGLLAKSRLYVHLSTDYDTAKKVGSRHGNPVVYLVDAGRMVKDSYEFFLSENGVWLTKHVPTEYIHKENGEKV